ncbi:MAG: hypothetical protein V2I33_14470 [Kangiellaceae bacterium]|jgi:hypothetical protein|nr:hypothetical protein [Kangiellaceae bacterium]
MNGSTADRHIIALLITIFSSSGTAAKFMESDQLSDNTILSSWILKYQQPQTITGHDCQAISDNTNRALSRRVATTKARVNLVQTTNSKHRIFKPVDTGMRVDKYDGFNKVNKAWRKLADKYIARTKVVSSKIFQSHQSSLVCVIIELSESDSIEMIEQLIEISGLNVTPQSSAEIISHYLTK